MLLVEARTCKYYDNPHSQIGPHKDRRRRRTCRYLRNSKPILTENWSTPVALAVVMCRLSPWEVAVNIFPLLLALHTTAIERARALALFASLVTPLYQNSMATILIINRSLSPSSSLLIITESARANHKGPLMPYVTAWFAVFFFFPILCVTCYSVLDVMLAI